MKYINWHQSIAPWIVLTQCLISGCLAIIIFDLRLFSNNKPAKLQSCCQGDPTQRSRECGLATLLVMMMMKSGLGCIPILSTLIFIFEVPNHCPLHWKKRVGERWCVIYCLIVVSSLGDGTNPWYIKCLSFLSFGTWSCYPAFLSCFIQTSVIRFVFFSPSLSCRHFTYWQDLTEPSGRLSLAHVLLCPIE